MIVKCKKCGKGYNCGEKYYGKKFACSCGAVVSVPNPRLEVVGASVVNRYPAPTATVQHVTVVVNAAKDEKPKNGWGVWGLVCVLASIFLCFYPVVAVIFWFVGFFCCLIGVFFRPRLAAVCGLLFCALSFVSIGFMAKERLGASGAAIKIGDKVVALGGEDKEPAWKRQVVISKTGFRVIKDGYITRPVISFTICNKTKSALSAISADVVLMSRGRKVPWAKDSFRYSFPGGLNPGETQSLDLDPGMFSRWAKLENRDDYRLSIVVTHAEDENGSVVQD